MTTVKLVLEGPTEREFVVKVLGPYVAESTGGAVRLIPSVLITSVSAQTYRGGTGHDYKIVRGNVARAIGEGGADRFSTMLDMFRFPTKNRPWTVTPRPADPIVWAQRMEEEFARDIGDYRFRPYLCLHEFESLLFTAPEVLAEKVPALACALDEMLSLLAAKASPEHINDGAKTAPSKRLDAWAAGAYRKPLHGFQVASAIGVDAMRGRCRHFNRWVEWLLSPTP